MSLYPKDISDEIITMAEHDLAVRKNLLEKGELVGYNPKMEKVHLDNSYRLEQIIKQYGYPTRRKVSTDTHHAAWLIIQHSISRPKFMKACYKLFTTDFADDMDAKTIAYLGDRIAFYERNPQRYGTQFDYDLHGNFVPWVIADPRNVDEYRLGIGLPPLSEVMAKYAEDPNVKMTIPPEEAIEARSKMEHWLKEVGWT